MNGATTKQILSSLEKLTSVQIAVALLIALSLLTTFFPNTLTSLIVLLLTLDLNLAGAAITTALITVS